MSSEETELSVTIGAIGQWLSATDLEDHLPTLLEFGYNSLAKCCRINEAAIVSMGISDDEDVRKFMAAVFALRETGVDRPSESPESVDPDKVLQDFIADMEETKKRQVSFFDVEADGASGHHLGVKLSGKSRDDIMKRISVMTMTGAHTAELDALLDELYEMAGNTEENEVEAAEGGDASATAKPGVSDLDFLKFLEEMKAGSGDVPPITVQDRDFLNLKTPASIEIEALNQELSQDVEEIIQQAELDVQSAAQVNKKREPEPLLVPLSPREPKQPPRDEVRKKLEHMKTEIETDKSLSTGERQGKLKETKILIAMEKLKDARQQKLVVKLLCEDGSSKMLVIEEAMTAQDVCDVMVTKMHCPRDPNYCILERLADFQAERTFEDHDRVVPVIMAWPRINENSLHFMKKPNKYRLCTNPQVYMPDSHPYAVDKPTKFSDEVVRNMIIKELFVAKKLPEIEGQLHYMIGMKGKWKKHYFSLRKSGLYYSTKGKSTSILDVVRLMEWCDVDVYSGSMYKKKFKAPTNYCLSLLPTGHVEIAKKHVCHLCAKTKKDIMVWIHGIRLAKHGVQLYENFQRTQALMPWVELEMGTDDADVSGAAGTPEGPSEGSEDDLESTEMSESSGPVVRVPDSESRGSGSEKTLTLLQKRFQQAWGISGGGAESEITFGDFSMSVDRANDVEARSPSAVSGLGFTDEDGMFSVRLK
eukprot:m.179732 g.179732  ORF g.179732 m.179732 type:complete len:704 (+) comp39229_c0_seq3:154-2265(+)